MADGKTIGASPSRYFLDWDQIERDRERRRKERIAANDYIGGRHTDDPANPRNLARRISISKSVYYERAKRIRRNQCSST